MAHTCNLSTVGGLGEWITRSGVQVQSDKYGETISLLKIQKSWGLGTLTHSCNPSTLEAKVGDPEVGSSRPAWLTWWKLISTKNTKITQEWWHTPVILATQEAEAGKFLEPRRRKLQSAEIAQLHSSLGNRARLCLKKQTKKKTPPLNSASLL